MSRGDMGDLGARETLFDGEPDKEPKGEKPRDLAWDALVEVCGYSEAVTQTERGRINAALKELRGIYPNSTNYAIGFDIRARAEVYAAKFPGMELTPQALVGNWSRCDPAEFALPKENTYRDTSEPPQFCETCQGDRMVVANVRADGAEEYAPCPDCHPQPMAAGFWRYDRTRHNPPDPKRVRAMMQAIREGAEQ